MSLSLSDFFKKKYALTGTVGVGLIGVFSTRTIVIGVFNAITVIV
jgi:hypothetical protein